MRVFFFEFVSGGGFCQSPESEVPAGSLLEEGTAMWAAACRDLLRAGFSVKTTWDARLDRSLLESLVGDFERCNSSPEAEPDDARFQVIPIDRWQPSDVAALAAGCETAYILAPEFDGHLLHAVQSVEQLAMPHLGVDAEFIKLTSDKHDCLVFLASHGIPVPDGRRIAVGETLPPDIPLPCVVKRCDGAGSMAEIIRHKSDRTWDVEMRAEPWLPGRPCSQSFVGYGDGKYVTCPPMFQTLADRSLVYLGGERVLSNDLVERATRLGVAATNVLPATRGYFGIDMILGPAPDGSDDFILEVNPRLTTSYIALRRIAEENLMQIMAQIAAGERPEIRFTSAPVQFLADGTILS